MKLMINCDLGEGKENDAELMPYINACNIACGGHFGNANSIINAIKLAKQSNVLVGAHPSFPDTANFGRKTLTITHKELSHSLFNQISNFLYHCNVLDIQMNHIKLHGALYNLACVDENIAKTILEVYDQFNEKFSLFVPDGSVIANLATNTYDLFYEAFIDRRYNHNLTLVNRQYPNAHIKEPELAYAQVYSIINNGKVTCIDGESVPIKADTFCLHGDNPHALSLVKFLRKKCL